MRLLVGVLRRADEHQAELGPVPGLDDLDRLLADIAAAGVAVEVQIDGEPRPLAPAASLSVYRIVQEALTNVVRHAGPTTARLHVSFAPDEVGIEVVDEGPRALTPRDVALGRQGSGHGLIGMRERAALFGGSLEAGPCGPGFRVKADLHISDLDPGDRSGHGSRMIRVVIADDQALVRGGFRVLVDAAEDMEVVAEAGDGAEAVTLTRRYHPDVVLMDIRMPVLDGIEATRSLIADPGTAATRS